MFFKIQTQNVHTFLFLNTSREEISAKHRFSGRKKHSVGTT